MCCRSSKKANAHSAVQLLSPLRPLYFVFVVDKRAQNESDIAVDQFLSGNADIVASLFKNGSQITGMNTGNVLKEPANPLDPPRCPRKTTESRSVPAYNRIFIHKTAAPVQVGDDDAHTASG